MAATAAAARGLLVKSGACLEAAAAATHVVFDKTGTLTSGAAAVALVQPGEGCALGDACRSAGFEALPRRDARAGLAADAVQLLSVAAVVARGSTHPLAAAVAAHAERLRLPAPPPPRSCAGETHRQTLAGKGILVSAREGGEGALALGSPEWLEGELGVAGAVTAAARARDAGLSVVALAVGGALVGVIGLRDELREGAAATLGALAGSGLTCWIASGDNGGAVAAAAAAAGLPGDRASGGLSPAGKLALVRRLQASGGTVVFVGDGVNDAAAMAAADVGVAMGAGAAVSMEAADVVVKESHLWAVVALLSLARRARVQIRANFVWAALCSLSQKPPSRANPSPSPPSPLTHTHRTPSLPPFTTQITVSPCPSPRACSTPRSKWWLSRRALRGSASSFPPCPWFWVACSCCFGSLPSSRRHRGRPPRRRWRSR